MKRETVSHALNGLDDRHISDTAVFSPEVSQGSPERTLHMNRKRIISIALAAALILAIGITAYAVSGFSRFTVVHDVPGGGNYESLSDLPKIVRIVGFPVTAPDRFSNGYAFSRLRVNGLADYDENVVKTRDYYDVNIIYSKPGAAELTLIVSPVPDSGNQRTDPTELFETDGIEVRCHADHYKFVPESYEKTEADLAAEAGGHYFISFGSEKIFERDFVSAGFVMNGAEYTLMMESDLPDALSLLEHMACELIKGN